MKKQLIHWVVDINVSPPKNNVVMTMAKSFGLIIKQKSLLDISGVKKLGLKEMLFPGEKSIALESSGSKSIGLKSITDRALEFFAVGVEVADHFLENISENIPDAWEDYDLVFGDIFENRYGVMFLLILSRKEKKCYFTPIAETFIPRPNTRFVCCDDFVSKEY